MAFWATSGFYFLLISGEVMIQDFFRIVGPFCLFYGGTRKSFNALLIDLLVLEFYAGSAE